MDRKEYRESLGLPETATYDDEVATLQRFAAKVDEARRRAELLEASEANLRARVAELKAERDRLRTLITPLVALADVLDSDEVFVEMRKPETWLMSLDEAVITSGDCFAARAALAGREE